MSYADLNINPNPSYSLTQFVEMGAILGFSALAVNGLGKNASHETDMTLHSRINLIAKKKPALRKETARVRHKHVIVAAPISGIEATNWAAEDGMVDLLFIKPDGSSKLRRTTAGLAAESHTALEVSILPLLMSSGLARSKIIKTYSESIGIAREVDMPIVLSSGADSPIHMRSPHAMMHIGMLLGLDPQEAKASISNIPSRIIERNLHRMSDGYILPGVEIVGDSL